MKRWMNDTWFSLIVAARAWAHVAPARIQDYGVLLWIVAVAIAIWGTVVCITL